MNFIKVAHVQQWYPKALEWAFIWPLLQSAEIDLTLTFRSTLSSVIYL